MNKETINQSIQSIVKEASNVLDLGCGTGELLSLLKRERKAWVTGVDHDEENVIKCLEEGLSVIQADIIETLTHLPSHSFDYVVISQTLQTLSSPFVALFQALRVSKKVILSFPNFAHFRIRCSFFLEARVRMEYNLSYQRSQDEQIYLHTYQDIVKVCHKYCIKIEERRFFNSKGVKIHSCVLPNLFAENIVLVLSRPLSEDQS